MKPRSQNLALTYEFEDIGQIAAGNNVVEFNPRGRRNVLLPPELAINGEYKKYVIATACGDSMIGAGVVDGSTVFLKVEFDLSEVQKKVCAIRFIHTNEKTIKRFVHHNDGTVTLYPENDKYRAQSHFETDIEILGIVKFCSNKVF